MKPRSRLPDAERTARRKASALAYYYRNREKQAVYAARYHREHKEIRSLKSKLYEEKNKERRREQKKIYRAENKDRARAYYLTMRDRHLAACAARYLKNSEKIKSQVRVYAAANKEKVRVYSIDKRARKKTAGAGKLSSGIAARLMILQQGKCPACRADLRETGYHLDHIEALSKGGSHEDLNIQLLCPPCNLAKHAKHPIDFMQSRGFLL